MAGGAPTLLGSIPRSCTFFFVEIPSVDKIVCELVKVETERFRSLGVIILVDLHYANVRAVHIAAKDIPVLIELTEVRFTASNLSQNRSVLEIRANLPLNRLVDDRNLRVSMCFKYGC